MPAFLAEIPVANEKTNAFGAYRLRIADLVVVLLEDRRQVVHRR